MYLLWKLFLMVVAAYVILNSYLIYQRRKFRHFKSPKIAISPLWFLGLIPDINRRLKKGPRKVIVDIFIDYHNETGWDVFVMKIFIRNIIFLIDLPIISKVLLDHKTFYKNRDTHKSFSSMGGVRIFGDYGLVNDPGTDVWYAKRRILDPAFHRSFLRTIMFGMNKVSSRLIRELKDKSQEGESFDICPSLNTSAFEAVSICGFDWDDESVDKYSAAFVKSASAIFKTMTIFFSERFTFNLPWRRRNEKAVLRTCIAHIREVTKAHLKKRIEEGAPDQNDILSFIIRSNSCSDQLTLENLVDEYLVFISAGMETTAVTMGIMLFYLMTNPNVYEKVQMEIDEVYGDDDELSFEKIAKLTYLDMVIKECLRIKPPVGSTGRECMKDNVVVDGLHFPKGCFIAIPQMVLQNDERYWENPSKFDPERFSSENRAKIVPYTYMPFMTGPRNCIGKNFAVLETKIIISRIVREFEIINPNPGETELVTAGLVTRRPVFGVHVKLVDRIF